MQTITGTITADQTTVTIRVVGYYSPLTGQIHATKSTRTRAENNLTREALEQQKQALVNKFNNQ